MRYAKKWLLYFLIFPAVLSAQTYCTAASRAYFPALLNLIGSIHDTNYEQLNEIAVFDLGLNIDQIEYLRQIDKVRVYFLKDVDLSLLTFYSLPHGRQILGWYAWKPVVIRQALDMFPSLLWIDAGSTVLKPLDDLFAHIEKTGYFLATIGDDTPSTFPVGEGTTAFVREQFGLSHPARASLLSKEFVMANIIGVSRQAPFIEPWVDLVSDLRYFADDGTAPQGWGRCRHDQTLLSLIVYLQQLPVFYQDYTQERPIPLREPFYLTWNPAYINERTAIYSSRGDLRNIEYYVSRIHFKQMR